MPQDIEFAMPFPVRTSPDMDAARARSLVWTRERGLITGPADEKRVTGWDIAGLMARWAPDAVGAGLDLIVNGVVLITMLDDQFDSPQGRDPHQAARIHDHLVALSRPGGNTAPQGPLACALKEVWDTIFAGTSPEWAQRTSEHHRWYLDSSLDEARNRHHQRTPSREGYFTQRHRGSGYVYPMLDMSQKAYGFELPTAAFQSPAICQMMEITAEFIDVVNDVHSLEKEEARGQERDNLVHVIMHETGCGRTQAIAEIARMADRIVGQFVKLEDQTGDDPLTQRFVDCMRAAMSGYLEWSRTTARYARHAQLAPARGPAYGDLLAPEARR